MGNRLTKIYTRTGDAGETGLADGARVSKDSVRMNAIGTIDELNSIIGVVGAHSQSSIVNTALLEVQQHLFDLGGELSMIDRPIVQLEQVQFLEYTLDQLNEALPVLKEFILPGGGVAGAYCHMARAVCRRAERILVCLSRSETVNEQSLAYLNRLSDLLFVMARTLARTAAQGEVFWRSQKLKD